MFTFALAGRGVIGCGGFLRVSLRLPWAEEVIGLSARLGWWGLYATIYFLAHLGCQGQGECHTLLICEKSVEIREICGRQLSAQCAKEQAGCIYSPTDLSDKHRCHAGCLSITQIAPSARQIDTDFSHAENLSMRARFNGYAPRGQKFIAQRQAKRCPGYNVLCSLRPVSAKC